LFEDLNQQNEQVFLIWFLTLFTSVLFTAALLAMTVFSFLCRSTAAEIIN